MILNKKEEPPNSGKTYKRKNCLTLITKESKDYLFFLMMILMQILELKLIFIKKYFIPTVNTENYNLEIHGRNFYDQPINDPIKKYDEVRKTTTFLQQHD